MAFTRKFLKSLGIDEEKIDTIMDAHTEVTNGLIAERDAARSSAPDIDALKKENGDLKAQMETAKKAGAAEVQAAFDAFRKQVQTEKENASKSELVTALLKTSGVQRDDFVKLLLGQIDLSTIAVEDGKIKDSAFVDALKTSYPGCFGEVKETGTSGVNPLSGGSQTMTKEAFSKLSLSEQMTYANAHPAEWAEFNK